MSETTGMKAPVLHYKCVEEYDEDGWFDVGKLYPAQDGYVADNQGYEWLEGDIRSGELGASFVAVWVLPDGTELEALE